MSRHHRRASRFKLKSFYVWHRYAGVTAAVFVIILSITGIALNHTERLAMDSQHVKWDWLLDWYGIQAPDTIVSYPVGEQRLSQVGRHLYLDQLELDGEYTRLIGGVYIDELIVAAVDQQVLLLSEDGELIERMTGAQGVPAGVSAIGVSSGQLVVQGGHGIYGIDEDFLRWDDWDGDAAGIQWSAAVEMPDAMKRAMTDHYRGEVLPVERVVLDLHSGRFLGAWGVYLMDAAALLLLFLASTGCWLWFQQWRKRRAHRKAAGQ